MEPPKDKITCKMLLPVWGALPPPSPEPLTEQQKENLRSVLFKASLLVEAQRQEAVRKGMIGESIIIVSNWERTVAAFRRRGVDLDSGPE